MIRYYNSNFEESKFRRLTKNEYIDLINEISSDEEIISVFIKDDVEIYPFIESEKIYNDFMNCYKSGHFGSYKFFAIPKPKPTSNNPFFLAPLNLTNHYLSIKQKVILPSHLNFVEQKMLEKRQEAISLRTEVKKENGLEDILSPKPCTTSFKIGSRSKSNSSNDLNTIKKNVSFSNILVEEKIFSKDDAINDLESFTEYIDTMTLEDFKKIGLYLNVPFQSSPNSPTKCSPKSKFDSSPVLSSPTVH